MTFSILDFRLGSGENKLYKKFFLPKNFLVIYLFVAYKIL